MEKIAKMREKKISLIGETAEKPPQEVYKKKDTWISIEITF